MINPVVFFLIFSLCLLINPISVVYGETYSLEIDDKVYDIQYDDLNGNIIAMDIDKETISLLIATENVEDSKFQITLPDELIRAENNEFAVLINGFEAGYELVESVDSHLTFFVPAFTEEIEIIGTFVVPEFPLGSLLILGSVVGILIVLQKSKKIIFK